MPWPLPAQQVLAASGSELLVVRGEKDGAPQLGFIVDTAVYSQLVGKELGPAQL